MIRPYIVNIVVAAVFVAAGLAGYFLNPLRPETALIAPAMGIILLIMTPFLIKGNRFIGHLVVVLTFLFGVQTAIMAYGSLDFADEAARSRRIIVFSIMSLAALGGTGFYIASFIQRKKALKSGSSEVE